MWIFVLDEASEWQMMPLNQRRKSFRKYKNIFTAWGTQWSYYIFIIIIIVNNWIVEVIELFKTLTIWTWHMKHSNGILTILFSFEKFYLTKSIAVVFKKKTFKLLKENYGNEMYFWIIIYNDLNWVTLNI